jgi:hypothetical protein
VKKVNGVEWHPADLDVDGADFLIWQRQLGTVTPESAAIPEPISVWSVVIDVGAGICRLRAERPQRR